MIAALRIETAPPPLAIDAAGQDLASGSTTWTALPDLGETTLSAADSRRELDYMHARYRSPLTSRFLSVDPVGGRPKTPQSWNRYAYVIGNPLNRIDPDGRADKGDTYGTENRPLCGDAPCPPPAPSDPVGRALNTLMIAAFTAPIQAALVPARAAGAVALSQASNAAAGAIANPGARLEGAAVGAALGTATGSIPGHVLLTPAKNVIAAGLAGLATRGEVDRTGMKVGLATGVAVGWLELAAKAGSSSPGGALLRPFAMGMDAMLQVMGGVVAANATLPSPSTCSGNGNCPGEQ